MERRPFGPARVSLPVLGQGTWRMEDDPAASVRAIRRGLDLGMAHIDTAEMYGSGRVEEIVGEAIRGRRDEVFLASKVLPSNASYEGTLAACERSLKRLGTDRLDLYLLHWPGSRPLEETIRAFEKLAADGKTRFWGVSNFDVGEMEQAERAAGRDRIACNQVLYHLGERTIEHALIPWCEQHGIAVVAYSPLGQGRMPSHAALSSVAASHRATPVQVALAFLTGRKSVFAIPKSSDLRHVEENASAGGLSLTAADRARLSAAFPPGPPGPLPIL